MRKKGATDKKPRKGSPRVGKKVVAKIRDEKPPKTKYARLIELAVDDTPVANIASEFKVVASTIYRWLATPEVAAEIDARLRLRVASAQRVLQSGAVDVARAYLKIAKGEQKEATREQLAACEGTLDRIGLVAPKEVRVQGSLSSKPLPTQEELQVRKAKALERLRAIEARKKGVG